MRSIARDIVADYRRICIAHGYEPAHTEGLVREIGRAIVRARRSHTRARDWLAWAIDTFGPVASLHTERALRVFEEAAELAQAAGIDPATAMCVITRVYSRPAGDVAKEIGQVGGTLEVMAAAVGLDVETETEREYRRVIALPKEHWQARHAAKAKVGITMDEGAQPQ